MRPRGGTPHGRTIRKSAGQTTRTPQRSADRDLIAQLLFTEANFWYAHTWQYVYNTPSGPELGARIEELVKMRGEVPSAGWAW
jgi:hypothetical protein